MPPNPTAAPLRTGWLKKRGGFLNTQWQDRWFILHTEYAAYFADPNGLKKGQFNLKNAAVVAQSSNTFTVSGPHLERIYWMQCPSQEACEEWMEAFSIACKTEVKKRVDSRIVTPQLNKTGDMPRMGSSDGLGAAPVGTRAGGQSGGLPFLAMLPHSDSLIATHAINAILCSCPVPPEHDGGKGETNDEGKGKAKVKSESEGSEAASSEDGEDGEEAKLTTVTSINRVLGEDSSDGGMEEEFLVLLKSGHSAAGCSLSVLRGLLRKCWGENWHCIPLRGTGTSEFGTRWRYLLLSTSVLRRTSIVWESQDREALHISLPILPSSDMPLVVNPDEGWQAIAQSAGISGTYTQSTCGLRVNATRVQLPEGWLRGVWVNEVNVLLEDITFLCIGRKQVAPTAESHVGILVGFSDGNFHFCPLSSLASFVEDENTKIPRGWAAAQSPIVLDLLKRWTAALWGDKVLQSQDGNEGGEGVLLLSFHFLCGAQMCFQLYAPSKSVLGVQKLYCSAEGGQALGGVLGETDSIAPMVRVFVLGGFNFIARSCAERHETVIEALKAQDNIFRITAAAMGINDPDNLTYVCNKLQLDSQCVVLRRCAHVYTTSVFGPSSVASSTESKFPDGQDKENPNANNQSYFVGVQLSGSKDLGADPVVIIRRSAMRWVGVADGIDVFDNVMTPMVRNEAADPREGIQIKIGLGAQGGGGVVILPFTATEQEKGETGSWFTALAGLMGNSNNDVESGWLQSDSQHVHCNASCVGFDICHQLFLHSHTRARHLVLQSLAIQRPDVVWMDQREYENLWNNPRLDPEIAAAQARDTPSDTALGTRPVCSVGLADGQTAFALFSVDVNECNLGIQMVKKLMDGSAIQLSGEDDIAYQPLPG